MIKQLALASVLLVGACTTVPAPEAKPAPQEQAQKGPTIQCVKRDAFIRALGQNGIHAQLGLVSRDGKALYEIWLDNHMNTWALTVWPQEVPMPIVCILQSGKGWFKPGPAQNVGD